MNPRRSLLLAALALACGAAGAQSAYRAGTHYQVLSPALKTADPGRIEVTEVFAYSCPHCFRFEPLLEAWQKRLPQDVRLVQVHVAWNAATEALARGYYATQALNLKDRTHMQVFELLHVERKGLPTAEAWAELLAGHGVPRAQAIATYNSAAITGQVRQAEALVQAAQVSGTPEMLVDGKYRVSTRMAGGQEEMLKVVDFLVAQERSARRR